MEQDRFATATDGFDRRSFIRRAAGVGVAAAWATPTIQSLASPAFAQGTPSGGCTACLTGGGEILSIPGSPVLYYGQEIRSLSFGVGAICCESGVMPTTIEVNAHFDRVARNDISFHFTDDLDLVCTKTGNPAPPPGTAECANRFTGTANDGAGNTLAFVFEDNGEPGTLVDLVSISITDSNGTSVLSGAGLLDHGNLQVHEGLGPLTRDCSGC